MEVIPQTIFRTTFGAGTNVYATGEIAKMPSGPEMAALLAGATATLDLLNLIGCVATKGFGRKIPKMASVQPTTLGSIPIDRKTTTIASIMSVVVVDILRIDSMMRVVGLKIKASQWIHNIPLQLVFHLSVQLEPILESFIPKTLVDFRKEAQKIVGSGCLIILFLIPVKRKQII
jgi:hypothetical protein